MSNKVKKVNQIININNDGIEIKLFGKSGKNAFVSSSSLNDLFEHQWYYAKTGYPIAFTNEHPNGIHMHRYLYKDYSLNGYVIDHINRNRLDNRMENLRICTPQENSYNRTKPKNAKNNYKGVYLNKKTGLWDASISKDGIKHILKDFVLEQDAAAAYDLMAEELFGNFAGKNLINK